MRPLLFPNDAAAALFWAKAERTSGCWLWRANTNQDGYGVCNVAGNAGLLAHRVAYANSAGPIPAGLQIDHLCRVRNCVNPAHLEAVTSRENTRRGLNQVAVRMEATTCSKGHEYAPENTYFRPGNDGRACRTCQRERCRRWRARKAAA